MKCSIPEISWHDRGPVLSVDFQPQRNQSDTLRLATSGTDTHVIIWYIKPEGEVVSIEVAADLTRHQKTVNVVRWSPSGEFLASGDDESAIFIWKQKSDVDPPQLFESTNEQDREIWLVYKLLRGPLEDVYDISWCPFSNFLLSGSVDNSAIIWDIHKGKTVSMLPDHKGFVQGVSWDPKNQYVVTMCSDRIFRTFDVNTKKVVARSTKTKLPVPESHPLHGQTVRLFYDGTLQSFFRRLDFSPDGELIAVPTGLIESEQPSGGVKPVNAAYIYSRYSLKTPICVLPCGESPALAARWSPVRYKERDGGPLSLIKLPQPGRLILAVATRHDLLIYDTQQSTPLAIVSNINYTRLTDLSWSSNGQILIVSSTDGYCSVIKFAADELGEIIQEQETISTKLDEEKVTLMDLDLSKSEITEVKEQIIECGENITETVAAKTDTAYKTPNKKETKPILQTKTPKSKDITPGKKKAKGTDTPGSGKKNKAEEKKSDMVMVIDEAAMEAWSQDGISSKINNTPAVTNLNESDDNTEHIKLVYEGTETGTPEIADPIIQQKEIKLSPPKTSVVPIPATSPAVLPKTPRRVNFITLSSPKSKKKLL